MTAIRRKIEQILATFVDPVVIELGAHRGGELDFDCTMSVDGHVYRTDEILPWLQSTPFMYPPEIEAMLWDKVRPRLLYAEHSCLVGIPHNRISPYPNPHEGGSVVELNNRLLSGERIDLDSMDFSDVRGVHQPIPYVWKKA